MRVKSCVASDGSGHVINLSDEFGCVLRPKMISRFLKARAPDERATVITYAFFHAFKFPDALSVHIKCKVEICRNGCLDHCQLTGNSNERKDVLINDALGSANELLENSVPAQHAFPPHSAGGGGGGGQMAGAGPDHDVLYDDIIHNRHQLSSMNSLDQYGNVAQEKHNNKHLPPRPVREDPEELADLDDLFGGDADMGDMDDPEYMELRNSGKFPHGPRQFKAQKRMGVPMAGPRMLEPKDGAADRPHPVYRPQAEALKQEKPAASEHHINLDIADDDEQQLKSNASRNKDRVRRRRSVVISDRKVRSADVGVSGLYDVISEADLAFSPDTKQEAVTVFQGKISEEVVYGICMPVPGFSILFIVVISATIVSALIAGSLLYRYQLQKEALEKQTPIPVAGTLASWMTLRMFRLRHMQHQQQSAAAVAAAAAAVAANAAQQSVGVVSAETIQ